MGRLHLKIFPHGLLVHYKQEKWWLLGGDTWWTPQEIEINITQNGTCPRGSNAPRTHPVGHTAVQTALPKTDHDKTSDKLKSWDILYDWPVSFHIKNVKVMKGKEGTRNGSRLKDTHEAWQLNAMCDPDWTQTCSLAPAPPSGDRVSWEGVAGVPVMIIEQYPLAMCWTC